MHSKNISKSPFRLKKKKICHQLLQIFVHEFLQKILSGFFQNFLLYFLWIIPKKFLPEIHQKISPGILCTQVNVNKVSFRNFIEYLSNLKKNLPKMHSEIFFRNYLRNSSRDHFKNQKKKSHRITLIPPANPT